MNKLKLTNELEAKDIKILTILDRTNESKISTEEISKRLGIPGRSIRYRINRLKEKGLLKHKTIIAHERKLGIKESFILIEENSKNRNKLLKILNDNQAINWYVPTTGKYNGYLVHAINIVNVPNYPAILLAKMKKQEIISDYNIFELMDYKEHGWNYEYFNEKGEWTWNWTNWYNDMEKGTLQKEKIEFIENSEITTFDFNDVQILKNLYINPEITQKDLALKLDLSESQISRKIKSLEQIGIIRGYRTGFNPYSNPITILCVFDETNYAEDIFGCLNQIPYPKTIAYETKNRIALGIVIPMTEIREFLIGIHFLGSKTNNLITQFYLQEPIVNIQNFFEFFGEEKNNWTKLTNEYEKTIKKHL